MEARAEEKKVTRAEAVSAEPVDDAAERLEETRQPLNLVKHEQPPSVGAAVRVDIRQLGTVRGTLQIEVGAAALTRDLEGQGRLAHLPRSG